MDSEQCSSVSGRPGWVQKPNDWNDFEWNNYDHDDHTKDLKIDDYDDYQYVIVLAGGLDDEGRNHPWVKDRLDVAKMLYQRKRRKIIILGGGTYHKPPFLNKANFAIHESTMGAKYLMDHGVDSDDLYREWASYDTIANAYFGFLNFIVPLQMEKVLIITSDFHMRRSILLFKWMKKLFMSHEYHYRRTPILQFLEVSTKYLEKQEVIEARYEREEQSVKNLRDGLIPKIPDFHTFYEWFYKEHEAYNCRFDMHQGPVTTNKIDEKTRASY